MKRDRPGPAVSCGALRWGRLLRPGVLVLAALSCTPPEPFERRVERELLLRQKAALERTLASRADTDHEGGVVVVIPRTLLARLLSLALPIDATVDRFHITANQARVDFEEELAIVRLEARVAWADDEDVNALVDVVGALEVLGLAESTGSLTARVEILGIETRDVQLGGLSPPVERLLDEVATRPAERLNRLLGEIEIPVRLSRSIPIPAVAEEEVTIAGAELLMRAGLHDVRVVGEHLWVQLDMEPVPVERPVAVAQPVAAAQPVPGGQP